MLHKIVKHTLTFLLGVWPISAQCQATAYRPVTAQSPITVAGYGLIFELPKGLFWCPKASTWIGADNGSTFYFVKPLSCNENGSGITGQNPASRREIEVFYSANVVEIRSASGDERVPSTDAELLSRFCNSAAPTALRMTLLGHRALSCIRSENDRIEIVTGTIFRNPNNPNGIEPDSLMTLTLVSTPATVSHDEQDFTFVVRSMRIQPPQTSGSRP